MSAFFRPLIIFIALLLELAAAPSTVRAEEAKSLPAGVPRYVFVPGQEITYRVNSSTKYWKGEKTGLTEDHNDVTICVLRKNPDGSYRLVIRECEIVTQTLSGIKHESKPMMSVFYADMFADGRVLPQRSLEALAMPAILFPPLPKDAVQAKAGWEDTQQLFHFACKPVESAPGFVFDAAMEPPFAKVFLDTQKQRYYFDASRGLIAKAQITFARDSSIKGAGTGTTELVAVKELAPDTLKQFNADADAFFPAVETYDVRLGIAAKASPEESQRMTEEAAADLKIAAAGLRQSDLKADAANRLARHEVRAKDVIERARTNRVGKPAPDFETTDINGNPIRLADLRGKVVVLDFWYRGCGWCIASMPQMNQLVTDFAGQPVAILGMNTDANPADARFVIDKMELKYTTVNAQGVPEKFGAEGFPTLIVIDQHGIIRNVHVGYSSTLRQEVGKVIRELLDQK